MRRWLAIFLLFLLPLQLAWAVAANYCQDEPGSGVQHFGHHAHADHGGADLAKKPGQGLVQPDQDCGCSGHLCGAHGLPAQMPRLSACASREPLRPSGPSTYPSADPPLIERPNWPASR